MSGLWLNDEEKGIIERLRAVEADKYYKPKQCVVCLAPIEQGWSGQRRRYCDRPGCRRRGARLLEMLRRHVYEEEITAKVREFERELMPESQEQIEFLLKDSSWTRTHIDHRTYYHRRVDVVDLIMQIVDRERQAAFRKLERFTVVFEQRADRAEERVAEFEEELHRLRLRQEQALHEAVLSQPRYISADPPGRAPGEPARAERLDRRRAAALLLPEGHSSHSSQSQGEGDEE